MLRCKYTNVFSISKFFSKTFMSYIGKNIKKIRKVNKLNQSQFADLFNLSRSNIGSYEEERAEPKTDILIKIAKHFSIPIELLITKEITLNDLTHFENSVHESHLPQKISKTHGNHIPFIPLDEYNNYINNHHNKEYLRQLNHLCLPLPENIRTRAFQLELANIFINGNNFHQDDIIIGSFVNKKFFTTIPRNQPYIIVTNDRIVCTHLIIENNQVLLKNNYETSSINIDTIEEIWTMIGRYESTVTPTEQSQPLENKVAALEQRLTLLEQQLKK